MVSLFSVLEKIKNDDRSERINVWEKHKKVGEWGWLKDKIRDYLVSKI